jgi:UDP-N-acetylmuramate--alanine ligase
LDSFLNLFPEIAVILNVDEDHLDYFKNIDNIKKSFNKFAAQTNGTVIYNGDDVNTILVMEGVFKNKVSFGFSEKNDYYAANVCFSDNQFAVFDLMSKTLSGRKFLGKIKLNVPGRHNVYNALAAVVTSIKYGIDVVDAADSLKRFNGVHRRFEILGHPRGITLIDDFAHHPTEIMSTLTTAKAMGFKRVIAVFQPHTFSRTYMLFEKFVEALSVADKVVLTEILPVRETNTYNIYSKDLAAKIKNSECFDTFEQVTDYITNNVHDGDMVITMGGGDIYKCAQMILLALKG